MLGWLILKYKDNKYDKVDDRRISYIERKEYIWWGSEGGVYYIIPTFGISNYSSFYIEICWLQFYYCISWKAISYEKEEAIATALRELDKNNKEE